LTRIDADKRSLASASIRGIRGYFLRNADLGMGSREWGETSTEANETKGIGEHGIPDCGLRCLRIPHPGAARGKAIFLSDRSHESGSHRRCRGWPDCQGPLSTVPLHRSPLPE